MYRSFKVQAIHLGSDFGICLLGKLNQGGCPGQHRGLAISLSFTIVLVKCIVKAEILRNGAQAVVCDFQGLASITRGTHEGRLEGRFVAILDNEVTSILPDVLVIGIIWKILPASNSQLLYTGA